MKNLPLTLWVLLLFPTAAFTEAKQCTEPSSYIIAAKDRVYLICDSAPPEEWKYFQLWEYPNGKNDPRNAPIPVKVQIAREKNEGGRFIPIQISQDLETSDTGKDYVLVGGHDPDITTPDFHIDISTACNATIGAKASANEVGRRFQIDSTIAMTEAKDQHLYLVQPLKRKTPEGDQETTLIDYPVKITFPTRDRNKEGYYPKNYGIAVVEVRGKKLQGTRTLKVLNLKDIFGQTCEAESDVEMFETPSTKDDAAQYYEISHKTGPDAKASFYVSIVAHTFPGMNFDFYAGDFLIQPNINIDIGTNEFANESNDRINLGAQAETTTMIGNRKLLKMAPGFTYETNRAFDKNNLLATFDLTPYLGTYYSKEQQTAVDTAKDRGKGAKRNASDYRLGYGVGFNIGIDAGRNISSETFTNQDESASIDIPGYSIFRLRPKVNAFVEYRRVTLESSETLRILTTKEAVGRELDDGTVEIRKLKGARSYLELTGSVGLDLQKHFLISITYKRGSEPPDYEHVDTIVTGFVVKY